MGTTGLVAVLFTDLVGSTETVSRLGAERAEQWRETHFALVREAIAAHSGTEVKNLGDGFMVAFAAASDAVACAVAVQQAAERHTRHGGEAIGLRAGIAVGEATVEGRDYFGTPVIEASRLCSAAGGGRILVTEMTRMLAGARGGHDFVPQGPMQLKGLPEPIPVHEVRWAPISGGKFPLPSRLVVEGSLAFVGRSAEREVLGRAWKRARERSRAIVLLAGEPGIGKTRLATEAAVAAHEQGGIVLLGTCDEDLAVPYQPFVEALRHLVAVLPPEDLAAILGRQGGDLARLIPELPARVPGLPAPQGADPETERYGLFSAVAGLLADASRHAPVLLVLDDLHWATKPTLLMLKHLVRTADPASLLVVGTYRDSDVGRGHPLTDLLADLRREPTVERIAVRGLSDTETVAFMEAVAGHELAGTDLGFAQAVYAETDGSPFFMRELLRHLTESGEVTRRDDRWTYQGDLAAGGIPDSVKEVIGRRLSRLPERVDRLLTLGAVIGREFDVAVLAAVAGMQRSEVVEALDEARTAVLVREVAASPGRFAFVHALIRHTLYEELGVARRMEVHRTVAGTLEALAGGPEEYVAELAHHWLAATPAVGVDPADTAKAARYAEHAGHRAMASLAYEEAVAHFDGALRAGRLADDDRPRRCSLLIDLGEAQRCAGDPAHRETLLKAGRVALELGDGDGAARAALANQRGLFSRVGGVDRERVAALEAALAHAPGDSPVRARLLASLASELHFAGDARRRDLGYEALALARRLDDPETLGAVLSAVWFATWDPASTAEAGDLAEELAHLAGVLGNRVFEFHAGIGRYLTAMHHGDVERADRGLAASVGVAEELGQPVLRWRTTFTQGGRAMVAGDFDAAERLILKAAALGEMAGQPDQLAYMSGPLGLIRFLQGRAAEAAVLLEPVAEKFAGAPAYAAGLASACAHAGRGDDARAILQQIRGSGFTGVSRDYLWLFTLCALAQVCAALDEPEPAEELHALLLPRQAEMVVTQVTWWGPVAHHLALLAATLGRPDEAADHFARAFAVQQCIGARGTLVHTGLEWARLLLRPGPAQDVERARTLLETARAGAREVAIPAMEQQADALLAHIFG